jgi:ABC-type sugar transport system permease subunit
MSVQGQAQIENLLWAVGTVIFIVITSALLAQAGKLLARLFRQTEAEQNRIFWGLLFAGPWIVGFIIFVVGPALASLYWSFTNYELGEAPEWIGIENYRTLLLGDGAHGRRFQQAMFNSLYYTVVGVPLQLGAALGMALLLNQNLRGVRVFRLVFYLPVILAGGPAILLAWRYMLASNGGFINEALQGLSRSFFLFDWLHRGFIYVVETFNGFYTGVARGDPIGPLKYTLPAVIGVLALIALMGAWSPRKQERARQMVEVLSVFVLGALLSTGLVTEPIDPSWTLMFGALTLGGVLLCARAGRTGWMRVLQFGGLGLLIGGLVSSLTQPDAMPYVLACGAAALPLLISLFGGWARPKYTLLTGALVALCVVMFVRAVPGQLDGGRALIFPRYLALQTALEQPSDQTYLEEIYAAETPSGLWVYGLVIGVVGALLALNNAYPRLQRGIMIGGLVFFSLLALGSVFDGVRYFRAFEQIAVASGSLNYHFSLFHNAAVTWPEATRVALWQTSELWSKPSLILITVWSSGAGMLIFLAALKGVPKGLYESAEVDGANRWQRFWYITLPGITPALFYNLIIGVIASLQTFETIYIMQTPTNVDSLTSAAFFLYTRTFRQLEIGQGAAAAWILVVVIVALTTMQFRYSKWVNYEA